MDGTTTVHLVTTDESLLASTRAAVSGLGCEFRNWSRVTEVVDLPPSPGDVILLDNKLGSENAYEASRRMTGVTRCRTFVITESDNPWAQAIAHFCGATDVLCRPLSTQALRSALSDTAPRGPIPAERRKPEDAALLPDALLRDLVGLQNETLIQSLTDPDTNLFNFEFLSFKLDEEFKRSQRFGYPLSCVMLGFEGPASPQVLKELAGIFLQASRDTDVLGRFDENSFLFLLPHTGPDGAHVMARRVGAMAADQGLKDLVGDPLVIAVGIAFTPHPEVARREDLFGHARRAFQEAMQQEGGGVVTTS